MKKGIKFATVDIIGILNSDAIFTDLFVLENIAKFHRQNDIEVSVGNVIQVSAAGKVVRNYSSKNWTPEKLKKPGSMPPHPTVFFRR